MQDRFNDFDLQVRSILEDAEMKPSRRVWKGVSSRLDTAAATRSSSSMAWAKWAGAAVAFAALSIGIFFSGTSRQELPSFRSNGRALASADAEIIEFIPAPAGMNTLLAQRLPAQEIDIDYVEDNDVMMETAQVEKKAAPQKKEEKKISRTTEETADPFALMAIEDNAERFRAGRTSIYAKGAIGGNDSDIRLSSPTSALAPGEGSSGFSEMGSSTYGVPFTLGLGVRVYLGPKISIGTGLDYSLLTRTFAGKYTPEGSGSASAQAGSVYHAVQYLGVPLDIYYDVISTDKLKFYAYAGMEAEYCISNKYTLLSTPNIVETSPVQKLQWSAGAGLGVEFILSSKLGLYIDPGLRYYFPCNQPKSIRTDKPVMVNFDAGLRFNF